MGGLCSKPTPEPEEPKSRLVKQKSAGPAVKMTNVSNESNKIDDRAHKLFSAVQIQEFRKAFDHFDEDGSGDLTSTEISYVLKEQGIIMKQDELNELLAEIDADGNGTVDFEEFLYAMAIHETGKKTLESLQSTVQRVIKLQRDTLPLFLARNENDPKYWEAEQQRKDHVQRVLKDIEGAEKDIALKKSYSRAAMSQSKSVVKLTKAKSQGSKLRMLRKKEEEEKQAALAKEKEELEALKGANEGVISLSDVLNRTPVTADENDGSVYTYTAFDSNDVYLYNPVSTALVTEVPQTFCMLVNSMVNHVSLVDDQFTPIKNLTLYPEHSDDDHNCFYTVATVPRSCAQVFLCSSHAKGDQVKYSVYCHYDTKTLAHHLATQLSEEEGLKKMDEAVSKGQHQEAVQYAQTVLFRNKDSIDALVTLASAQMALSRYRLATEAAETLLTKPQKVLPSKDPRRLKIREILAYCERARGFYTACIKTCERGLQDFPDSEVLKKEKSICEEEIKKESNPARWNAADSRALACPAEKTRDIQTLARYLTDGFEKDVDKVRAIFRWVTENVEYDGANFRYGTYAETDLTAEGVLHTRKAVCQGYVALFKALCDVVQCESRIVTGYARAGPVDPRTCRVPNHAWVVVNIDDKWSPADPTWSAGILNPDFSFKKTFNNFYWLTSPEIFVNAHLPEDPQYQYIEPNISLEDFISSIYLSSHFFQTGIELLSHKKSVIEGKEKTSLTVVLKETKPDRIFLYSQIKNWDNAKVAPWNHEIVYNEQERTHTLHLPKLEKIGVYELVLYYSFDDHGTYTALLAYRLNVIE
eukprot:c21883_g4_i1.p1 GENE.c21883_g4_i1~~c21883_g4_i1.p1  ORF type:complete len:813 (-),score=350.72 c21883_g4_i1:29-2467(-)